MKNCLIANSVIYKAMTKNLKVFAFTRYERIGASSRLRILQYVPLLRDFGIDVDVQSLFKADYLNRLHSNQGVDWLAVFNDYLSRVLSLRHIRKYDLIWIEKELFPNLPRWVEQFLRACRIPYVVDFDDAMFHIYDLSPNPIQKFLFHDKLDKVMRDAALVVCGNAYLSERAQRAGARRIEIVPTVIDLQRYPVKHTYDSNTLTVGWIGSPPSAEYLNLAVPALRKIATEFPVQLKVVGAPFSSSNLAVDCKPWSEETEVAEIENFDIGIMPLLDSPWERGKCGYKLIQCMACGLPVIGSPVGVNTEIIQTGINGYLATTPGEWENAFRDLVSKKELRITMGLKGREAVEKFYCLQVTAPRIAQLLHEASKTVGGK